MCTSTINVANIEKMSPTVYVYIYDPVQQQKLVSHICPQVLIKCWLNGRVCVSILLNKTFHIN